MSDVEAKATRTTWVWIPREVSDLVRDGVLQPRDYTVVAVLLKSRRRGESWSEASASDVAAALGISSRTAQRSLNRLVEAGILDRRRVGPRNPGDRPAWRHHFPWLPEPRPGRGLRVLRPS